MKIPERLCSHLGIDPPSHGKSMTLDVFIDDDGKTYEYPIFRVDKPPAIIIFPVTHEHDVIVIKQYRHAANRVIYELPGGLSDGKEDDWNCARRELFEETGFGTGGITSLSCGVPIFFEPASLDFSFKPFVAVDCFRAGEKKLDATEQIEVVILPLPVWIKAIVTGSIMTDAKSLATTFMAWEKLRE